MDSSLSSSDLNKKFSVSLDASGGFGGFSAGTKDSFLNQVKEN